MFEAFPTTKETIIYLCRVEKKSEKYLAIITNDQLIWKAHVNNIIM